VARERTKKERKAREKLGSYCHRIRFIKSIKLHPQLYSDDELRMLFSYGAI